MDQILDYRAQYFRIKTHNQILQAELEDCLFRQSSLKRQLQIMNQFHQGRNMHSNYQKEQIMKEEIERLRGQLISQITQKEQLEVMNRNHLQKISDLKYNNGELKSLNQKMTQVHNRQIQMMKREADSSQNSKYMGDRSKVFQDKNKNMEQKIKELEEKTKILEERLKSEEQKSRKIVRERQCLHKKLQSCAEIAKEMENYYILQIRKKNQLIKNKDQQIHNLNRGYHNTKVKRDF